jgi:hypothetical protein
MCTSDLVSVDEHGHVRPGKAQRPFNVAAFAIHSEIHKARRDVNAACYAHSIHGSAFSCFRKPLEMIFQDALKFYKECAVYPPYGGAALTTGEGAQIAKALGSCQSVVPRRGRNFVYISRPVLPRPADVRKSSACNTPIRMHRAHYQHSQCCGGSLGRNTLETLRGIPSGASQLFSGVFFRLSVWEGWRSKCFCVANPSCGRPVFSVGMGQIASSKQARCLS